MQVKLSEMDSLGKDLASKLIEQPIMVFRGDLGAGKTTLVKKMLKHLSSGQNVQSPTFSIVNTYIGSLGEEIYHFDCYRLKDITEAMDIGLEEYLDSGNICLMEWPEVIIDLIPESYWDVQIAHNSNDSRNIEIKKVII